MLAAGIVVGSMSTASAERAPLVTKQLAKKMRCAWPESSSLSVGGSNTGVGADAYSEKWCSCIVRTAGGRIVYGYPA